MIISTTITLSKKEVLNFIASKIPEISTAIADNQEVILTVNEDNDVSFLEVTTNSLFIEASKNDKR